MSSIRVLIVDASPVIRQTLTAILTSDPEIEVIGAAADPYIAARRIQKEVPDDVIILDVDMPRMDGITFLRKLMSQRPLPAVMCSSIMDGGSQTLMEALDAGAVDVILKPEVGSREFLLESQVRVCDVVKAAAVARIHRSPHSARAHQPKLTADAILPPPRKWISAKATEKVVLIGASTGGTGCGTRQLPAACAHVQADRNAGDHALRKGSSG
jgi:two-component system chemotaxis response regulator CheB